MNRKQLVQLSTVRARAKSGEARTLRVTANLSLSEVAAACGVDQSTVWRWEAGTRKPMGAAAIRYALLLDGLDLGEVAK